MNPGDVMRSIAVLPLVLAAGLGASGGCSSADPEETQIAFHLPFQMALGGCSNTDRFVGMTAILNVAGYDARPCSLDVAPTTLEVSGTCDDITVGVVRQLGLGYWLPHPDPNPLDVKPAALAYIIGWVDLRIEHIGDTTTEVPASMTPDGVSAKRLTTNLDVESLRDDAACAMITDDAAKQLCAAEAWAKAEFATQLNFDIDSDTSANIVEACDGSLFP